MVLFLKNEHRNKKWDLIFLNTYQNEDKSHAILLHLLNQETEVLKAGAEGEVQLPVHVIYVHMLNILQEGAARCLGRPAVPLRAHRLLCQAPGPDTCRPQPRSLRIYPITPLHGLFISADSCIQITCPHSFSFCSSNWNSLLFPSLNSNLIYFSNLELNEPIKKKC